MKDEPIILNPPKKKVQPGMKRNLNLLLFVLISLGLLIAIPYYLLMPKEEAFKLQQYEMAKVGVRDFIVQIPATGKVVAGKKSALNSPAEGTVVQIWCKTGDVINAGEIIAGLDSRTLKEDLKKTEAQYSRKLQEKAALELEHKQRLKGLDEELATAIAAEAKLQKELPTWVKLYDLGEISQARVEEEKTRLAEAGRTISQRKTEIAYTVEKYQLNMIEVETAIKESAEAKSELAEKLQSVMIKADITGKIVNLFIKPGDNLKPGSAVAEIVNEESFLVQSEVALDDIDQVKEGQKVSIDIGGERYSGKVAFIAAVAKEKAVQVDVEFTTPPQGLRPDAHAALDIEVALLRDCLALPRGRYLSSGQEKYVFRVDRETAIKTKVSFGLIDGNYVEVRSGLNEGEQVITSSYDNFIHLEEIELNPEGGIKI